MRFSKALRALTVIAGLGLASPAAADTYIVGVENIDYLPQYRWDDHGYSGFARELFDAFAKASGHTLVYQAFPVARLYAKFLDGEVDLKYPDHPEWATDGKAGHRVVYSDPVVAYVDGVNVRPGRLGQGVDAVRTLGVLRGFTARGWLDRIAAGAVSVQGNSSFPALLEQTLIGRVDGAYGNVAVVQHLLRSALDRPGALVFDSGLPHVSSHYHLSTIKHPALIAAFNDWMTREGPAIAALKARHRVEAGLR